MLRQGKVAYQYEGKGKSLIYKGKRKVINVNETTGDVVINTKEK